MGFCVSSLPFNLLSHHFSYHVFSLSLSLSLSCFLFVNGFLGIIIALQSSRLPLLFPCPPFQTSLSLSLSLNGFLCIFIAFQSTQPPLILPRLLSLSLFLSLREWVFGYHHGPSILSPTTSLSMSSVANLSLSL